MWRLRKARQGARKSDVNPAKSGQFALELGPFENITMEVQKQGGGNGADRSSKLLRGAVSIFVKT